MKENTMIMNFEPLERVIFVQSTKIGTNENKAIHSSTKCSDHIWSIPHSLQYILFATSH